MKFSLLFLLFLFVSCDHSKEKIELVGDRDASFPGGAGEMKKFIQAEVRYPEEALENSEQGRVYVGFIVEEDGRITTIEVMNGGVTPVLDAEAKRLVSRMPKWIPGAVNGKAVRARCRLPITFTLDGVRPQKNRKKITRKRTK